MAFSFPGSPTAQQLTGIERLLVDRLDSTDGT